MKKDYIVFVGRFQPFHNGHMEVCKKALSIANHLIIVVGSYKSACTIRNPWTFEERREMIELALSEYKDRITILPIRDYLYSDIRWITSLQNIVTNTVPDNTSIGLIGHRKDESSFYLDFFPQWDLYEEPNYHGINSTDIRRAYFNPRKSQKENMDLTYIEISRVPKQVIDYLSTWAGNNEKYEYLTNEYKYIDEYKKKWDGAPYQPVFVTTDAVVVMNGHILVVKRKVNPGKGLFALPGGFVNPNEKIEDSMIRELKEETKIVYPIDKVKSFIVGTCVFDHPYRSLRGRTITHAYFIHIKDNRPLPGVTGGDDAAEAMWMPINDVYMNEDEFFEDHVHIITHFVNKA